MAVWPQDGNSSFESRADVDFANTFEYAVSVGFEADGESHGAIRIVGVQNEKLLRVSKIGRNTESRR